MNNPPFKPWILLLSTIFSTQCLLAGDDLEVSASVSGDDLEIRIQGIANDNESFELSRRESGQIYSASWTLIAASIPSSGNLGVFTDTNVTAGILYEYHAEKVNDLNSDGYGVGGIDVALPAHRGTLLLVIEEGLTVALTNELEQLKLDLIGDGWTVERCSVPRHDDNPVDGAARMAQLDTVRSAITNLYFADTNELKSVYLIGRVPVPQAVALQNTSYYDLDYSSYPVSFAPPDGHYVGSGNHQGCWPTDLYYSDIYKDIDIATYTWKDEAVYITNSTIPRLSTEPGDGKFDNYRTPTLLELQVGRIDFSNMPASPLSETELTRQYLNKAHRYRSGQIPMQRKAVIGDSRHTVIRRNFDNWFGPGQYGTTDYPTALQDTNGYYAIQANGGGSFTSVGTLYTSHDLIAYNPKMFLHMAHGSYFGDWDSENNLLRAALAGSEGGMASLMAMDFIDNLATSHAEANWSLNHMALGQTIGFGLVFTMNRFFEASSQFSVRPTASCNLLGDPSLRLFPLAPPSALTTENQGSDVRLSWSASPENGISGYQVFRSSTGLNGTYTKLTTTPVTATVYTNAGVLPGTYHYQVKAVKTETTGAGTYENTSLGILAEASDAITVSIQPVDLEASEYGDSATLRFLRTGSTAEDLTVLFSLSGTAMTNDYLLSATNSLVIASGNTYTDLIVTGISDDLLEGQESIEIALDSSVDYSPGIYIVQTIDLLDGNTMPAPPSNLIAVDHTNSVELLWSDQSDGETRFIIERREIAGGATVILDNTNSTYVTTFPASGSWTEEAFEGAYNGNCLGVKKIGGTYYVDFLIGQAGTGEQDLYLWHPSGSTAGDLTDGQNLSIIHSEGTNTQSINMQIDGATWKSLGRFTLDADSILRIDGVTTSYRWCVADAIKMEKPFTVVHETAANTVTWTDSSAQEGFAYEYRIRAGLANTSSVPCDAVAIVAGGGAGNQAPLVDAGDSQTITLDQSASLNGSASDPDSGPLSLSFTWAKESGPGTVVFSSTNTISTTASFSTSGVYQLSLLAFDGLASASDTVYITVSDAPTAGAGATNGTQLAVDEFTIALWNFTTDGSDASTNSIDLFLNSAVIDSSSAATAWMASPSGAALRVENFPQAATGSVPDILIFDSANPIPLTLETRIFVEAWGSNSTSYTIFGMEQNYDTHINLEQDSSGSAFPFVSGNSDVRLVQEADFEAVWTTGVWHHLMFTFDGTNEWKAYLDGGAVGSPITEAPNFGRTTPAALIFGNFVGYLDDIRLSRVIRTFTPGASGPPQPTPPVLNTDNGSLQASGGELMFQFNSEAGQLYTVEVCTSLLLEDWTILSNEFSGTGAAVTISDTPESNAYYRVKSRNP